MRLEQRWGIKYVGHVICMPSSNNMAVDEVCGRRECNYIQMVYFIIRIHYIDGDITRGSDELWR